MRFGGIIYVYNPVTMTVETWLVGTTQAAYTNGFGSEINSLAAGNAVLSTVIFDNSANGDTHCMLSFSLGSYTTGVGSLISVFAYPLNQDGSTYGDGRFASSTTALPATTSQLSALNTIDSVTQVQTGGILYPVPIPFSKFKLVLYNGSNSGALASGSNTVAIRTMNLQYK